MEIHHFLANFIYLFRVNGHLSLLFFFFFFFFFLLFLQRETTFMLFVYFPGQISSEMGSSFRLSKGRVLS